MTLHLHYFHCYDTEDDIVFVDCVVDLQYPKKCANSNTCKLTINFCSILNTNLAYKLGYEFGQ